ncbi:MAG: PEP-CTERM sorting domain-containing protein [Limisphaerales bacterium]
MAISVIAVGLVALAHGQEFLNLNFESAYDLTNPPEEGEQVALTNAIPGWTAYAGTLALSEVWYSSNNFVDHTVVELEGGSLAISGAFSVGLYGGSIGQTGLVPEDAESLQFESTFPDVTFRVSLGGQRLSYSLLSVGGVLPTGGHYSLYGANIPADMDGQMEMLTFWDSDASGILLDNIGFSPTSVPEPPEYALIGLGIVLLGLWRRR